MAAGKGICWLLIRTAIIYVVLYKSCAFTRAVTFVLFNFPDSTESPGWESDYQLWHQIQDVVKSMFPVR